MKFCENLLNLIGNDNVPMVLVAQKCDLKEHQEVSEEEGRQLAEAWSCPFVEASAKLNRNVGKVAAVTMTMVIVSWTLLTT